MKGGTLKGVAKVGEKEFLLEGTWKADGDKLHVTSKAEGLEKVEKKDTVTVTKLTDTDLVIKDGKGQEDAFKRKAE